MGKSVSIIDPSADPRWDRFIYEHKNGSLYHHSLWKEVIQKSFGYQPLYFIVENSSGNIIGGMPFFQVRSCITGTRLVSLSFSDYCDVLLEDEDDFGLILNAVVDKSKKLGTSLIETRVRSSAAIMQKNGFSKRTSYKNHVLILDEPLEVIRKHIIHKSYRYDIKNAQKSGLRLVYGTSEKDMNKYFDLYVNTRKHHGLFPMPYSFFKNIWDILYPKQMLSLILAEDGSKTIAGIILLRFKNFSYALSNSSDRNYLSKRPNHLLWWTGIEQAHQTGLRYFDFGRTSADNQGLLYFKKNWGTKEHNIIHYYYGPLTRNTMINTKKLNCNLVNSMCRVLPDGLLKLTGAVFYKHLG